MLYSTGILGSFWSWMGCLGPVGVLSVGASGLFAYLHWHNWH